MEGICKISGAGPGRIYVYGMTIADRKVDFLSIIAYVEQYDETSGQWTRVNCWRRDTYETEYLDWRKILSVERGHSYRIHCEHLAGDAYPYEASFSESEVFEAR